MEYYQKGLYRISQITAEVLFNSYFIAVTLTDMLIKMSALLLMKAKLMRIINSTNILEENPAYIDNQHARASLFVSATEVYRLALFQGIFTAQLYHLILAFKKQNTLRPSQGLYLSFI